MGDVPVMAEYPFADLAPLPFQVPEIFPQFV